VNHIRSYPKVYALGHKYIDKLLDGPVFLQEKYDGSQLSWQWIDNELLVRSKGKEQYGNSAVTDKMFNKAIEYLLSIKPINNYIFRGEYFNSKKHNTLEYGRLPLNGLVLYDVEQFDAPSTFYPDDILYTLANHMQVEYAHTFDSLEGSKITIKYLDKLLEIESSLSGTKVEGIVIKNYTQFTKDGKVMMGKYVSPEFQEKHAKSWPNRNPSQGDIVQVISSSLNTNARFTKAVQYLRDNGQLTGTTRDIGPLMRVIKTDTITEEKDWIKDKLWEAFGEKLKRSIGNGLPEWYKSELAKEAVASNE